MFKTLNFYVTKVSAKKAEYKLPFAGLILFYVMVYLLKYRFVGCSRLMGEFLQKRFSMNYAVNSLLAYMYRQQEKFGEECDTLMRIVPSNSDDVGLLTRAAESAAYSSDLGSLESLLDITKSNVPMHSHIRGLLAFAKGEPNYAAYFQEAVRSYLDTDKSSSPAASGKTAGVLMLEAVKSGRSLPEFIRVASNIREFSCIDDLLTDDNEIPPSSIALDASESVTASPEGSNDPVVLISCSQGYLSVFADWYIRTFRRKNRNIIHFHVLADDISVSRDFIATLKRKHSNIHYSIEPIAGNSQTYITISRFLICRDIMRRYNSDVLISDMDCCVDFDLRPISRELTSQGCDFGLCNSGNYPLPWGRFAVGFSYFRVANKATGVFLDLLSRYLRWLYASGGFFSMDTVAVATVHEYMLARGHNFKLLNLNDLIDFKRLLTNVPKKLQMGKIRVKFGSGVPK